MRCRARSYLEALVEFGPGGVLVLSLQLLLNLPHLGGGLHQGRLHLRNVHTVSRATGHRLHTQLSETSVTQPCFTDQKKKLSREREQMGPESVYVRRPAVDSVHSKVTLILLSYSVAAAHQRMELLWKDQRCVTELRASCLKPQKYVCFLFAPQILLKTNIILAILPSSKTTF